MNPDNINALAEAINRLKDDSAAAAAPAVTAVALKLPNFWVGNPEVWFAQAEAQFATRQPQITADDTKYNYVLAALDNAAATEVQALILAPPANGKYDALRAALVEAFGKTQEQKDAELLALNGLGDRTPTALLRYIQSLNANPETLIKAIFLAQLPIEVRRVLAASSKTELSDLAKEADKVMRAAVSGSPGVVIAAARTPSNPTQGSDQTLCYFHSRFGKKARNCKGAPCHMLHLVPAAMSGQGNASAGR